MTAERIKVGDTLYREVTRRYYPPEIKEITVSKISGRYFEVDGWEYKGDEFNIITFQCVDKRNSSRNIQLYRTPDEIKYNYEHNKLSKELEGLCLDRLSLDQLRQIAQIINL